MRNRVAASEYDLLTIARALVGETGAEVAEPILRQKRKVPPKIGPTAMALVQETIAKGVVLELARRGGWRPTKHLRDGKAIAGRLWDRHKAPKLEFSPASMELLMWLVETPFGLPDVPAIKVRRAITMGDEILLYLACDLLTRVGCASSIAPAALFGRSALCWLGFPEALRGEKAASNPPEQERFAALCSGQGSLALEAMQADLAHRWIAMERRKRDLVDCARLQDYCDTQDALLGAFLGAVEKAKRQDLTGFLLEAASELLARPVSGSHWVDALDTRAPLSQRAAARRSAGSFLRSLGRMKRWSDAWRVTAFFDDGYEASQLLLKQWERLGDQGWQHAEGVLRDLESLDAGTAAPEPTASREPG